MAIDLAQLANRAEAINAIAIVAINVLGSTISAVRSFLKTSGATEEELDAAIDAVIADARTRKALADAAAGRT